MTLPYTSTLRCVTFSQLKLLCLVVSSIFQITVGEPRWTETDESKRIADLKREERRQFESEYGSRFLPEKSSSESSIDYNSVSGTETKLDYYNDLKSLPPYHHSNPQHHHSNRRHNSHHHYHHHAQVQDNSKTRQNWCFHCISPWTILSSDMRQVVLNLLDLRRANAPGSASVMADCTQPRAIDALHRQTCRHSYCQTLVLTDHEAGSAFTLRGCAENFGAIDERLFETRGDNTCKKLHDTVDIQECVCKNRRYCYSGADRDLDYIDNEEGVAEGEISVRNAKFERHVQVPNYGASQFGFSIKYTVLVGFVVLLFVHNF